MSTLLAKPDNIPDSPGVYMFRRGKKPIYIGKAGNLRKRLVSYFAKNAGEKVLRLRQDATRIGWIELSSEIEAFLKEAELIKRYQPTYNVLMRDDKSYFYVAITKDKFPKIFIVHEPRNLSPKTYHLKPNFIGPFTSGSALRQTLRMLRGVFPYCTCKIPHKRPCLNAEIGRCASYCCMKIQNASRWKRDKNQNYSRTERQSQKREYAKNIVRLTAVLKGKTGVMMRTLKKEMKIAARNQEYEKAAKLRDQIEGLENIFAHRMLLEKPVHLRRVRSQGDADWIQTKQVIRQMLEMAPAAKHASNERSLLTCMFEKPTFRVEGYDISNISGTEATGSMVVFINGRPDLSQYRMFGIKTVAGPNDVAMHREVIRRRMNHPEWPYPDLMVIDGGKPQLNAVMTQLALIKIVPPLTKGRLGGVYKINLPPPLLRKEGFREHVSCDMCVVALAKREEELYVPGREKPVRLDSLPDEVKHFFQRVRDESHRFAKKYHHKRREMALRNSARASARTEDPEYAFRTK